MPERMITSTICHDEPKFYLNLVNFDVEVYVTYNINAMDINVRHEKNDDLVLNQHTIPYIHVARTVTHTYNCIYIAFCKKMVY